MLMLNDVHASSGPHRIAQWTTGDEGDGEWIGNTRISPSAATNICDLVET